MIIDRQLNMSRLPPLTKPAERVSTSTPHSHKSSIPRRKVSRRNSSELSYGSSGPDSNSDDFDDTYTGQHSTPDWARTRVKRKKTAQYYKVEVSDSRRGGSPGGIEEAGPSTKSPPRGESSEIHQMSEKDVSGDEMTSGSSSGDDEYTGPYKGPHLHTLSVEWISDRLDRSFGKYKMTLGYLTEWAAWWPKNIVRKHHRLDSAGMWLLAVGVHKWWNDLKEELESPATEWPEGLEENGKEDLRLRVRQIALVKESEVVAAKRMMLKDGDAIPADSVMHLCRGRRKRGSG